MAKLVMVTGGSRSGKSIYAEDLCLEKGANIAYVATANIYDDEMANRVSLHKSRRGEQWTNYEVPLDLIPYIDCFKEHDYILVDCITMLVLNIMFSYGYDLDDDEVLDLALYSKIENQVLADIQRQLQELKRTNTSFVIVTNEIGLGIVPDSKITRLYRDIVGRVNQYLANLSDEVILLVSGIPLKIKGEKNEKQLE